MLLSIALIIVLGYLGGNLAKRLTLPSLVGMLLVGVVVGPFGWNLLSPMILSISSDIRRMALIIILLRAGLNLNIQQLKQVGRPALLMCFLPALFEMIAITLIAPLLFPLSTVDALLLGTVIAAVSPAVIVPRMVNLMEQGRGTEKQIPQMILIGASVDDVFVIVLFSTVSQLALGNHFEAMQLLGIPSAIVLGIAVGFLLGRLMQWLFKRISIASFEKIVLLLVVSFCLVSIEDAMTGIVKFSGLLAIMTMGMTLNLYSDTSTQVKPISNQLGQLWRLGEIFLFVLVGASINIQYAILSSGAAVALIVLAIVFRILAVFVAQLGTNLSSKEKLFTALAYLPKATVQAAIGGIPLAMGIQSGELILTVAVLSILITAPIGAWLIDLLASKWLIQAENK
ncbi:MULTISPECIES: cation:proton antiporter [unclassified Facklamia]|uniref:cation:proton antiporter n=1 Tax=Aerococcaceae TaxID=186827 RepID=UPI0013B9A4F7|nr:MULTISPECIES: cation:proton antiporter [unclassified Facklamia]NEW63801.1 sodium:proton antiporter [Facklamia sp. 252]NEW67272.1 sodium:proton antiporter [Facklamia sp. 253]QQD65154.1 cation:proton antiporter [Aerococcaceae bacterium zg-252]